VTFRRDGGLPVTANDYSGLTDDGDDFVCPDHHCTVCGGSHRDAAQFDACAYNGPQRVDLDPPCSVDAAYAILGAQGLLR
jgi:hypothetical protein